MKRCKSFLAAVVMTLSTVAFAGSPSSFEFEAKTGSISYQIERMLSDSGLVIEEDFTATVFFEMTGSRKIKVLLVESPNEEVNAFLKKRLTNQKLHGDSWKSEKVYELPVRVQATR
ncbi:hypothetical protein OQ279_12675 [Salinimicrobium sp. MT39]|uniref:DUF4426 domain-containing protein n=1 Tax=Salinimicrobium profundisediminis TaxID=2994553 RepID=A0A9X3I2I7_9FLAO|nr:hypothetical protein [Salinimicrobium profundisediminis]MCX2839002.1 hypothetical protein [Salinimicrobium profundisediminis]